MAVYLFGKQGNPIGLCNLDDREKQKRFKFKDLKRLKYLSVSAS
jgi:hypothetical protein